MSLGAINLAGEKGPAPLQKGLPGKAGGWGLALQGIRDWGGSCFCLQVSKAKVKSPQGKNTPSPDHRTQIKSSCLWLLGLCWGRTQGRRLRGSVSEISLLFQQVLCLLQGDGKEKGPRLPTSWASVLPRGAPALTLPGGWQ